MPQSRAAGAPQSAARERRTLSERVLHAAGATFARDGVTLVPPFWLDVCAGERASLALRDARAAKVAARMVAGIVKTTCGTLLVCDFDPRIHDLRHTFICQALLRGQQDNQIDHVVDAISTYVGHAKVSDTYWYISATPELMSEASQRFSRFSFEGCQ